MQEDIGGYLKTKKNNNCVNFHVTDHYKNYGMDTFSYFFYHFISLSVSCYCLREASTGKLRNQ